MPEVGAEEEEEPGVLSPPRPPQLLPNLGCPALIGPTLSVWEELPQGCLRKPGRGGLQVCRRCTLPVTEKLGPRRWAWRGGPTLGTWAWYGTDLAPASLCVPVASLDPAAPRPGVPSLSHVPRIP